jgi:predicted HTH domain antitoxin
MSKTEVLNAGLKLPPEDRLSVAETLAESVFAKGGRTREVREALALKLFDKDLLTIGQAAEVAGYTKREFMDLLSREKVSIARYSKEELEREMRF